ncbi:MAG: aminotransferase class I/II-fold pyridoxal phosphate-dependent enzyme [Acidimicrobiia bacterium]|nr:aminotransferase class I/II-fold pyridoxal phosphate-dependent enzyme [Acidimicrobiia bacterium]
MAERIFLSAPHLTGGEMGYIQQAFDDNWIGPLGPHVEAFEAQLVDIVGKKRAVALSSGTSAIHLALRTLGVERGDLVLASSFTFVGSVAPLRDMGAEPWFVDSNEETWNMDPELLADAVDQAVAQGRKPKAAIVVDIVGQCADYDPILEICNAAGIPIIEDAAEALGATYKGHPAGSFGKVSILSFNGNKILTTSTGGAFLSDEDDLVDEAFFLATQARDPAPHYEHSTTGYNYRMSSLLAAFGRAQLESLEERVEIRRAIFERYEAALGGLAGISFMPEAGFGRSNRWLTALTIDPAEFGRSASDVMGVLAEHNIESRPVWKPMHMQPVFAGAPRTGGAVSERLFAQGLCLPSGSALRPDQQDRVIELVAELALA